MSARAPLAAAFAAILALAPLAAAPAFAVSQQPVAAAAVTTEATTAPKVVIVVGATEGTTPAYRSDADTIAAEALKYTPNVIKIYSPNATYATVKAAAQGASIFIYLGHGYGFPSPYRPVLSPDVQDGMGLNAIGGIDDNDKKYYGESYIAADFKLAKNAVVLLNHLCYSAGSSESGDPEPTVNVAKQRVDNFASGFIKAGARAVLADSWTSGVTYDIRTIFTTNESIGTMFNNAPNKQGHAIPFIPQRNPQYQGILDPDTPTTGFHRSIVGSLGMMTSDVVAGAAAASTAGSATGTDTTPPELWSTDGPTKLTPNFDGSADKLNLLLDFSETATWTATVKDADGNTVRTQTGSGHQGNLTWDLNVNGAAAPAGSYAWSVDLADAAGNVGTGSGTFSIQTTATPDTAVLSFKPTTPTTTLSSTVDYALTFAGPVTGLTAGDFTRTGSSPGCVVGTPAGAGTDWTVELTSCGTGSIGLYLNSGAVVDGAAASGPAGPITAPKVTMDGTVPKATAPLPSIRTGLALETASTTQRLLMAIRWSGTDSGAGIASYDVARSYDGGAFAVIASATTATSLNWTMTPGHTYRFEVRARDKAGNVGSWAAASTWYPSLLQGTSTSLAWTGTWSTGSTAAYSGGTVKYATAPGASVSYAFSGRAVAWVTTLRATAGEAEVWIDGVKVSTIDTYAATTTYRQVVFSKAWSSYGSHTIQLVVVGTADRPRVDLDAFEVIK